ncbi:MAG: ABC transporter permease [Bacillota bacterium]
MKLGEYIRLALSEIFHNKIRTFLTLIGIIIGIAAVILIIFVVQGAEKFVMSELETVVPMNLIQLNGRWNPDTRRMMANLKMDDLDYLEDKLGNRVKAIAPQYRNTGELRYQGQEYDCELIATTPSFQQFYDMTVADGRFLSKLDVDNFSQVIVLGNETAENLFEEESAVGKKITLYGVTFTVIGVLPEAYQSPMFPSSTNDTRGFVPLTTFERLSGNQSGFTVSIRASEGANVAATQSSILDLLDSRYGLTADGRSKFRAYNMSQELEIVSIVKIVLMVLLSGVASITLLVAGIGVMNIMLVIIIERTKEIGLRKALGATKRDILMQFIIESIILCMLGGVLGILLGYLSSDLVMNFARDFIRVEVDVPSWAAILSIVFTTAVGLFFGIYPAAKAARLDPIEALHYE